MKIAYVSFEHPLGITGGGIGTYIGQIGRIMALRGHEVEIFSATYKTDNTINIDNCKLHLINAKNNADFRHKIFDLFYEEHQKEKFDIIESAEYGADALIICKKLPEIPLTIKLHTPSFLVGKLNSISPSLTKKLRFIIGGLLKGKLNKPYWKYRKNEDIEYEMYLRANTLSSPSLSLKNIVLEKWGKKKFIAVIPYPFSPGNELLNLPLSSSASIIRVTFIGKLEIRKGILELIKALPNILSKNRNIKFCFVGAIHESPQRGKSFKEYIEMKLSKYLDKIEFAGFQPTEKLPLILSDTDICVFPSLWENFPNVCLESMSAGKAVIGTNNGGMADMITHLKDGYLIPPGSANAISKAVIQLAEDDGLRKKLGNAAREKVLTHYNAQIIGEATENIYQQTISSKSIP